MLKLARGSWKAGGSLRELEEAEGSWRRLEGVGGSLRKSEEAQLKRACKSSRELEGV